ncbi:MAG: WYL domain-containing transcriptional regulator [Clostridia bacterium]|nr:WYL domain-containing transcriptional regulator [Clostridia bacterium]
MKQNEKMLYLLKILIENTNEEHPLTANELIERLANYGAEMERKSIYSAIETLISFGYDIQNSKAEPKGYYMASRDFELAEIKLLMDAVLSSRVITSKKSIELINKIKKLTDINSAARLQRQVVVTGRAKMANERLYYSIDAIHEAIANGRKISFQYCEYDTNKNLVPRKGGREYIYTPSLLLWDDEKYYLVAYDKDREEFTNFRADKMINVKVLPDDADIPKQKPDAAVYATSVFSMFHGEYEDVVISAGNHLAGAFLDKFGMDITLRRHSENAFAVKVNVAVSSTFFAWLFQFGSDVMIVSPESVAEKYKNHLKTVLKAYK